MVDRPNPEASRAVHGAPIALLILFTLFLGFVVGAAVGERSVRMRTTVRAGSPFYSGVFFGECGWNDAHTVEFCATDDRR